MTKHVLVNKTFTRFGGVGWETAGLANIFHALGIKNPITGMPYTEAFLLGVGGGLGGGYMLYEAAGGKHLVLGLRHGWQRYRGEFSEAVCARLGVAVQARETGSAKAAEAELRLTLANNHLVLATCSQAALPHHGLPRELCRLYAYGVTVLGIAEDQVLVDDRAGGPLRLPLSDLQAARAAITTNKNRMLVFAAPAAQVAPDLTRAVLDGLREGLGELLHPPIKNFGLSAWGRCAELLISPKDKKGWPQALREPRDLMRALVAAFRAIEIESGGGALRGMYADFLDEAAQVLPAQSEVLAECAARYRGLAASWTALAETCLPEAGSTGVVRRLLRQRHARYRDKGTDLSALRGLDEDLRVALAQPLLLGEAQIADLRAELSQRMRGIATAEAEAVARLKQVL